MLGSLFLQVILQAKLVTGKDGTHNRSDRASVPTGKTLGENTGKDGDLEKTHLVLTAPESQRPMAKETGG